MNVPKQNSEGMRSRLKRYENTYLTFAKKRYRWLALLGGLIISGTLTIRDHLNDDIKEFAASAESAKNLHRIEVFGESTNGKVDQLDQQLRLLRAEISSTKHADFDDNEFINIFAAQLDQVRGKLDYAREICNLLPGNTENFRRKLSELDNRLHQLYPALDRFLTSNEPRAGPAGQDFRRALIGEVRLLSDDVNHFDSIVLNDVEEIKIRRRYLYSFFSLMSYLVIAVGFGLSLTGKLFDNSVEVPQVEG